MRLNQLLCGLREKKSALGCFLTIDSSFSAELLAHCGFSWLCIDMQHGMLDFQQCITMLQAISTTETTPLVRVPSYDSALIGRALDAGALGIIIPTVENRSQAEYSARACRYYPSGVRSVGPSRAGLCHGTDYIQNANEQIVCIVMVETYKGLENLEEIASTPGVNGIYVGPADLTMSMGLGLQDGLRSQKLLTALERILEVCHQFQLTPGIFTENMEYAREYLLLGFQLVGIGIDIGFIATEAKSRLAALTK